MVQKCIVNPVSFINKICISLIGSYIQIVADITAREGTAKYCIIYKEINGQTHVAKCVTLNNNTRDTFVSVIPLPSKSNILYVGVGIGGLSNLTKIHWFKLQISTNTLTKPQTKKNILSNVKLVFGVLSAVAALVILK